MITNKNDMHYFAELQVLSFILLIKGLALAFIVSTAAGTESHGYSSRDKLPLWLWEKITVGVKNITF